MQRERYALSQQRGRAERHKHYDGALGAALTQLSGEFGLSFRLTARVIASFQIPGKECGMWRSVIAHRRRIANSEQLEQPRGVKRANDESPRRRNLHKPAIVGLHAGRRIVWRRSYVPNVSVAGNSATVYHFSATVCFPTSTTARPSYATRRFLGLAMGLAVCCFGQTQTSYNRRFRGRI